MDIDLSHVFDATPEALWPVLLDPQIVAACIPGMQSVEVLSDTEYRARIKVKIAFISAHFTLHTVISDLRAPHFLRARTQGEDSGVGSTVSARCDMTLEQESPGRTRLSVSARADVLGRLGALGLNPMRTKAERMWEQFCGQLAGHLAGAPAPTLAPTLAQTPAPALCATPASAPRIGATPAMAPDTLPPPAQPVVAPRGWLNRFRRSPDPQIHVAVAQADTRVELSWPAADADRLLVWLDRHLAPVTAR